VGFHFVGIQENTHKLQGCGGREGFTRGDRDIELCKQRKNVTESCEAVRPGWLGNKKEVIQDIDDIRNTQFGLNNPFKFAGKFVKEVRSTPQAEGENGVAVVHAPPFHV